jgi:hypothetical protein
MPSDMNHLDNCEPCDTRTEGPVFSLWRGRQIGPWGATARGVVGAGAFAWAVAPPHDEPWLDLPGAASKPWGILIGAVLAPVALTLAMRLRGRSAPALRLGKGPAIVVTVLILVAAQIYPVAVIVAIAFPLLVQAVVGRAGCEVLTIPNLVLRRHDYLMCLPFSPVDEWERRRRTLLPSAGP